jgi:DNA-binding CsgD family transcriptional regulator
METHSVVTSDNSAASSKPLASLDEEIEKTRQQLSAMEAKREQLVKDRLAILPKELGYGGIVELIEALMPLTDGRVKLVAARTRGKIDQTKRDAIAADLREDKMTANQIAERYDVSAATVNNVKKAAGLVKAKRAKKK